VLRGLFVTGTDTGVGKTVVAAAILAALRARGVVVHALKPVLTGLDEPADPVWPRDHELLALLSGAEPDQVAVLRYGPPVSPHLAGELAGRPIDPAQLRNAIKARLARGGPVIVEGVGGLLVPLANGYDVRALAADVGLPLVIAARPGLGTINHTLLTVEAARAVGLEVAGVVVTPWPRAPTVVEHSNRETLQRLSDVAVSVLPTIERPETDVLAQAGAALPLDSWLALAAAAAA
jgi:dethiobiotin synthetase